jgi:hypothetical protein
MTGRWAAACVLVGIGAGVYYAFAIVWPTQVAVVYSTGYWRIDSAIASIIGAAVIAGQVAAGMFATKVRCLACDAYRDTLTLP